MGKVVSKAIRPLKNFNVENRAQRILDSEIPRPAPRHPSTAESFDNIAREHPEFLSEQKQKHEKLAEFLKNVKVDSTGINPEIRSQRSMPEDRHKAIPSEYGFPDPENIPEGRASLRQALEFIASYHLDPRQNSAQKIATDYKLDPLQVQNVVKYFQTLQLHIPKEMLKKYPKLLSSLDSGPSQSPKIQGADELLKIDQGNENNEKSSADGIVRPQK